MANNSRLDRLRTEITKTKTDIERQQERLKTLEQRLLKVKQTEVMKMLEGAKMEPEQLQKVLADYMSDKALEEAAAQTADAGEAFCRDKGDGYFEDET